MFANQTGVQTIFSCKSEPVNLQMQSRACFTSQNFYKYEGETELALQFITKLESGKYINNYCPFDDHEIERHIKFLDTFTNDSQKLELVYIKDTQVLESFEGKEVLLKISGSNKWHRLVMIWCRYLYESPFQWAMKDAWKLVDETGMDPFVAVQITMNGFSCGNTNHTLYGRIKFDKIPLEKFKELFEKLPSKTQKEEHWGGTTNNPSIQSLWKERKLHSDEKTIVISKYNVEEWDLGWNERKEIYEGITKWW